MTPAVPIRAANISGNVRMSSIGQLSRFAGRVSMSGGRRAVVHHASIRNGRYPDRGAGADARVGLLGSAPRRFVRNGHQRIRATAARSVALVQQKSFSARIDTFKKELD